MKVRYNTFFIVLIFLLYGGSASSQEGYKSGTLFYYIHTIQKDETLMKIASIYDVTVNEIMEVNTTMSNPEKIVEGQKIKVPNYSYFIGKYPRDQWTFLLYRVKQGDKLKGIAKEFHTDTDDIKGVNPGIENKPVVGSEIRIPIPKQDVAQVMKPEKKDDRKEQEKLDKEKKEQDGKDKDKPSKNPALTFNWGNKPNAEEDGNKIPDNDNAADCERYSYRQGTVFNISIIASLEKDDGTTDFNGVSFLRGALIAVNDMKNNGLTIKLNSFDAGKTNSINRILQSPQLKESNIIIAPVALGDLNKLAAFAKENKIHLVIPYDNKAYSLVVNNPYIIQLHPPDDAIYRKLTSKQYNMSEIVPILVRPEKADTVMLENYRATLKKRFGTFKEYTHTMGFNNVKFSSYFKDIPEDNKLNLIFVCSNTQSFISDLFDKIASFNNIKLNTVKYKISVYGRDSWRAFGIINKSLYFDLNLHLVQPLFVDYNNDETKLFVQLYRKAYNDEPGRNAFLGYDASYYFMAVLNKYGTSFQDCISGFNSMLLQSNYKLRRNKIDDGFVNDGCFLVEYMPDNIEIKRE